MENKPSSQTTKDRKGKMKIKENPFSYHHFNKCKLKWRGWNTKRFFGGAKKAASFHYYPYWFSLLYVCIFILNILFTIYFLENNKGKKVLNALPFLLTISLSTFENYNWPRLLITPSPRLLEITRWPLKF